jgi:hypothetical protein
MRFLAYALLLCLIALPFTIGGAFFLALSDQPTVNRATEFTPAHIERAKRIFEKNDPRTMKAGVLRTISLSQDEVDVALNYLASRYANGSSRTVLRPGAAAISASIELPRNPLGRFLNISAVLHETGTLPVFDSLEVGRLPVPAWFANMLLEDTVQRLNTRDDYRIVGNTIKKVGISDKGLTITYDWQADILDRIKAVILPREDQDRLKAYQDRLVEIVRRIPGGTNASLANLLPPLFELAAERSAPGDPVAENRAVIVVVAFYVNGRGLGAIVPAARDWPRPPPRKVLIAGREDFPQHFTISAAIAANAGAPLSDAIGLYKEVDDSRGGSGFSFNDIAADRAGTRFGELAAGSRGSAIKLQRQISAGVRDTDILPPVADLPEFLSEAEFKCRYGGIGGSTYKSMMADIERRVAALPLYH